MAKPFQSPTNHTTRTCATLLMSAGHSPPPWARLVPCGHAPRIENPGTGPRTCAILSISAGHSPPPWARFVPCGHAPRIENPGTGPRTCATLLMSAGHSPPPRARLVPYGHAPRIENPGTGPRTCAILSMSAGHSPPPRARLVLCGHAPRNARRAGIAPRPSCLKKEIYEKETCTHISWHWTGCSGRCSPREPGQFAGFGRCCNGTPSRSRCRRASCRQYRWRWCRRWSPGCRQWR